MVIGHNCYPVMEKWHQNIRERLLQAVNQSLMRHENLVTQLTLLNSFKLLLYSIHNATVHCACLSLYRRKKSIPMKNYLNIWHLFCRKRSEIETRKFVVELAPLSYIRFCVYVCCREPGSYYASKFT